MHVLLIITLIVWFVSAIGLTICVLLHSGKGTGFSDMMAASLYNATSGTSIIEKNLDRITVVFAVLFMVCLLVFMLNGVFPKGTIGN